MMDKKPIPLLRRLEFLILLILFLVFTVWTVRKCNATRDQYQQRAAMESAEEEEEEELSGAENDSALVEKTAPDTLKKERASPSAKPENVTPLYVTVDGLNMRSEPKVGSEVIATLRLHEEVFFTGEVTSFRDSLNLGNGTAYEPWIKVRHAKGRTGWVFGSGVSYYKK